jgi:fos-like antigen
MCDLQVTTLIFPDIFNHLKQLQYFIYLLFRGRRQPARGGAEPTNDDDKRRLIRRERNKEAAARCRKRRVDQTVCLEEEVSQWEERNDNWKREIETLEAQKRHLLSLLDGHRTGNCKMGGAKKL